jgi:hypothetical protein
MSELTPKQACELCLALYGFPDAPPVAWAAKGTCGPVYWGLARDYAGSGSDAVVFRGSTTPLDFARDLLVTPTPFTHPSLGPIHAGFWQGMEGATQAIYPLLRQAPTPIIATGHSLGGAHAALFAGILASNSLPNHKTHVAKITFGEPRPALTLHLRLVLTDSGVEQLTYVNQGGFIGDIVPALPPGYRASTNTFDILHASPHGIIRLLWGPLAPHHLSFYYEGLSP